VYEHPKFYFWVFRHALTETASIVAEEENTTYAESAVIVTFRDIYLKCPWCASQNVHHFVTYT